MIMREKYVKATFYPWNVETKKHLIHNQKENILITNKTKKKKKRMQNVKENNHEMLN